MLRVVIGKLDSRNLWPIQPPNSAYVESQSFSPCDSMILIHTETDGQPSIYAQAAADRQTAWCPSLIRRKMSSDSGEKVCDCEKLVSYLECTPCPSSSVFCGIYPLVEWMRSSHVMSPNVKGFRDFLKCQTSNARGKLAIPNTFVFAVVWGKCYLIFHLTITITVHISVDNKNCPFAWSAKWWKEEILVGRLSPLVWCS